ncbi:hypothetical protein TRAPUB_5511 [Trametes pubescens]|uniref:Uncharacterized protein n=1 Tax=Trametes pubescens TaxID=154538 RepID=A0A1M2V891_TRAPU|nr:hypothetical protein TRAPUB_5511 [Trametes pubescens]
MPADDGSRPGVNSAPSLRGASDGNSRKGPILPWLRALDGLNTHDEAYRLSASGGVTTALVLPGSANAIGGQGAVIKLRPPTDRSPTGMLLESPYETGNTTVYDPTSHFRFRQMKHACGENPGRVYSGTRMDTIWAFRQGYEKAWQIRDAQDAYCVKARNGQWSGLGEFPEDLQWEALVDVLRGRVKLIQNIAGKPPAAALFATHSRYKRESYRGSEFAPRILADAGIHVVMKSDHPVLDSRFLLFEV